jgi:hypothetical protein
MKIVITPRLDLSSISEMTYLFDKILLVFFKVVTK